MDAPVGPDQAKADEALRALFQEVGLSSAPSGMEARIMQRIAVATVRPLAVSDPLLPKWTWGFVACATVAVVTLLAVQGTQATSTWSLPIPSFSLESVFSTKWVWGGIGSAVALLALDTWLGAKRFALQRH
mgnify:FL=1